MNSQTWDALDAMFATHPVLRAEPVAYEEIDKEALQAGFSLDSHYREFVHRYGGAIVGPYPIFGLRRATAMGRNDDSVFEITGHYRTQGWPGTSEWLIISTDHSGNPIGLDQGGKVWISDHDFGGPQIISNSFEDYLRKHCLKLT
jgi:hypothetical protein